MATTRRMDVGLQCAVCHKAAFYVTHNPTPGDYIKASECYNHEDKAQPKAGEAIKCQYCGNLRANTTTARLYLFYYDTGEMV